MPVPGSPGSRGPPWSPRGCGWVCGRWRSGAGVGVRVVWRRCGRRGRCRWSGSRRRSGNGWCASWPGVRWRTAGTRGRGGPLARVKTVIGRLFRVGYAVQGVWRLLRRHGWSVQVPAHRALELDDGAVGVWHEEVWPRVKDSRRTWAPSSASRTRRARA
ncbi:helix-turn-helix domain-containing protein [Saccharothrix xinjiangensis]|uniref:Winged helix-turn-helix domain-containing protein n=1 Tax=Saccharothrix xinjiangensis TaxID=204798 RepID=A0ABV9Y2X3_9PSEU